MKKLYSLFVALILSCSVFAADVMAADAVPDITVTFDEGSYSSTLQSRYFAQIQATPTITAENVDSFEVYYNLYMGATKYRSDIQVQPVDGQYAITIEELMFSRLYRLEVYAVAGDYVSESASVEITTVDEPRISILSAVAENVTENSADIVVEFLPVSLGENLTFQISATSVSGPTVESVITTDNSVTLSIKGLNPGVSYTYNISVKTSVAGSTFQTDRAIFFETLLPSKVITIGDISYTQIENGAAFTVSGVETAGFDDDEDLLIDVYFQLKDSDAAPQKAVLVTDGTDTHYEYTFENLKSFSPYTAIIFGGAGEYGTDSFVKGTEYKRNFVSGESSGIDAVIAPGRDDTRYYDIHGVEVKNPAAGGVYIKVGGNRVEKVILK